MKHVTLKSFGWYPDGHTREALDVGAERDFGDAAPGMMQAGMIGEIKPAQSIPVAASPIAALDAEIAPAALPDTAELDFTDTADRPRRGRPRRT